MDIALRQADRSDAKCLTDLEEICMRGYAEALWGTWRPSATPGTLDLAGHEIIEADGLAAGCIAVTWHPDHLFIEKLYLWPSFQRLGIGASVLGSKTEAGARLNLPTRLSVLTTNPADRFYKREGFVLEAETPERRVFCKPIRR
jgi:GNAT superfamily N-acetyltransferase